SDSGRRQDGRHPLVPRCAAAGRSHLRAAPHRDWRAAMTKKWSDIRRKHSPKVEERIRRRVEAAAQVMTLDQLRRARALTQVELAKALKINQGAVSTMEKRTDMYVSTLRKARARR